MSIIVGDRLVGEKTAKTILVAAFISIAIHLIIVFFGIRVSQYELARNEDTVSTVILSPQLLDSVKSLQETAEDAPENANFASDRNLQADEETSPSEAPTNLPSPAPIPQSRQRLKPKPEAQSPTDSLAPPKKLESFTLSDEELVALNDPRLQADAQDLKDIPSAGFIKRLKRGDQLKLNAYGLDYGQYIVRMKERLKRRWNPMSTVTAAMQEYREVTVELAIVLNDEGEIVDIRILQPSFFDAFDQEAVRAMRASGPFPNPPDSLIQDDNQVYMPWRFTLFMRGWGSAVE